MNELKAEIGAVGEKKAHKNFQNSKTLDDTINNREFYHNKMDQRHSSNCKASNDNQKIYENVSVHTHSPSYKKSADIREQREDGRMTDAFEGADFGSNWKQHSYKRPVPRPSNRYQFFFPWYCYSCYMFGHKVAVCRSQPIIMFSLKRGSENIKKQNISDNNRFESINHFEALSKEKECSKCNNFGHPTDKCKSNWTSFTRGTEHHRENCGIALQA